MVRTAIDRQGATLAALGGEGMAQDWIDFYRRQLTGAIGARQRIPNLPTLSLDDAWARTVGQYTTTGPATTWS